MSAKYSHLMSLNGDVMREQSTLSQIHQPWKFQNMLPSVMHIWIAEYLSDNPREFLQLQPYETKYLPPNAISNLSKIYVFYKHKGKLIPFMQEYTVRNFFKDIKIGGVTYTSDGGAGYLQSTYSDMRGIWLKNRLPIPLDVYYKGNLVAQLGGYNGTEYLGGGASTLWFDNSWRGVNFLDTFEFAYSLPGEEGKKMFSVTIDDEQCMSMFIGVVTGGMWGPDPDNAVYRVDQPSYTGITFYLPVGQYNSRETNPYAPF